MQSSVRPLLLGLCLLAPVFGQEPATRGDFVSKIQPLLVQNCLKCHSGDQPEGGLRLDTRGAALKGGDTTNKVLIPGNASRSDLIKRVRSGDDDEKMPP